MITMLYPPYIEGKLSAQYGNELAIPFQYNRATGENDVKNKILKARVKTINSNVVVDTYESFSISTMIAKFNIDSSKYTIGEYYKIQLAWQDSTYYSTVGIFKYTSTPIIQLEYKFPMLSVIYKTQDSSEKVQSYSCEYTTDSLHFKTYASNAIIQDIDYQFQKDTKEHQYTFNINCMGLPDFTSTTQLKITINTINNIILSEGFNLSPLESTKKDLFKALIQHNKTVGETNIIIQGIKPDVENIVIRKYLIESQNTSRSLKDSLYYNEYSELINITDKVEHGQSYIYEIIAKDKDDNYQIRTYNSSPIYFDDMYLSDKERNYCIQFNPKISSFKTTILEQKQNTLGGKYPFFSRNGQTQYKEFPISGLISRLMNTMDADQDITESTDPNKNIKQKYTNTDLSGENIYLERQFRLELLDWLNNGQPKLFRSPTEGNYIVRLMNVSLTPNDTLGRMLYTFNCTAYEMDELNYKNLQKYNLI